MTTSSKYNVTKIGSYVSFIAAAISLYWLFSYGFVGSTNATELWFAALLGLVGIGIVLTLMSYYYRSRLQNERLDPVDEQVVINALLDQTKK